MQGWEWEGRFYPLPFQGNAHTRKFRDGRGRQGRRPLRPLLRRHDPGRVRRPRARARRWTKTACGPSCCSRRSRASAATGSSKPTTKTSRSRASQAWNDWMLDEWCAAYPDRFIPQIADPVVGPAARGARDRTLRGEGIEGDHLRREPVPDRPAVVPVRPLGPGVRRRGRHRPPAVDAHRHVVGTAARRRPTRPRRSASRCAA